MTHTGVARRTVRVKTNRPADDSNVKRDVLVRSSRGERRIATNGTRARVSNTTGSRRHDQVAANSRRRQVDVVSIHDQNITVRTGRVNVDVARVSNNQAAKVDVSTGSTRGERRVSTVHSDRPAVSDVTGRSNNRQVTVDRGRSQVDLRRVRDTRITGRTARGQHDRTGNSKRAQVDVNVIFIGEERRTPANGNRPGISDCTGRRGRIQIPSDLRFSKVECYGVDDRGVAHDCQIQILGRGKGQCAQVNIATRR